MSDNNKIINLETLKYYNDKIIEHIKGDINTYILESIING